jgi:allantoicase
VNQESVASFNGLVDLAAESIGGSALYANDEFFAGVENLLKPGRGVFLPDEYTERGKWMDGWESRRKRQPGNDFAIVRLGVAGRIRGLDIDTNHFLGNHPPYASVEALSAARDASRDELLAMRWTEILPQAPLRPGSQNLFSVQDASVYTHVRLQIYPDGGVARFRVYGDVVPDWSEQHVDPKAAPHLQRGEVDLAAVQNGGLALACSDMFFGPMNNLIAPGRADNMGGGWETRRRRGPGHDWILVRLGARGSVSLVEVDTNHFKGNYPDRCTIEGVDAAGARITDLVASKEFRPILPETKLSADTRHFYRSELVEHGPFSHVRLSIFPDGGVSRLRVYGKRVDG